VKPCEKKKQRNVDRAGGVAQVVEYLLNKLKPYYQKKN
jgi:hypothetical protein